MSGHHPHLPAWDWAGHVRLTPRIDPDLDGTGEPMPAAAGERRMEGGHGGAREPDAAYAKAYGPSIDELVKYGAEQQSAGVRLTVEQRANAKRRAG